MNNTTTVRNKIPIVPLGSVFLVVDVLSVNNRQSINKILLMEYTETYKIIAILFHKIH